MEKGKQLLAEYYAMSNEDKAYFNRELFFFGQPGLSKAERLRMMYLLMFIVDGVRIKSKKDVPVVGIVRKIVGGNKFESGVKHVYESLAEIIELLL